MKVDLIVAVKLTLIKYRVVRGKHFSSEIFFIKKTYTLQDGAGYLLLNIVIVRNLCSNIVSCSI